MSETSAGVTGRVEESDVIVVGGSLGGLVIAYLCASYGYSVRIIERSPVVGGIDQSFRNKNGRIFDFGLHGLDYMRSEFTTHLLQRIIESKVYKHEKRRGIVLRNHLIDYNAPPEDWPDELRALFPSDDMRDDLGNQLPTRQNLARCYGEPFAELIMDEVLASFPAEAHQLGYGVEEWELMPNIYPWFFPRVRRTPSDVDVSRVYHDGVRETQLEHFLYPKEDGFGAFANAFCSQIESLGGEVIKGASDLEVDFDSKERYARSILAKGRRFHAPRIYWCAPPQTLADLVSKPIMEIRNDVFVLGSFEYQKPVRCDYTELIFGDPEHLINRVSFPGRMGCYENNLVSVEFAFERRQPEYEVKDSFWLERWAASLQRLGIVEPGNQVVEFDFKAVPMMYNCYGIDGQPLPDLDFSQEIPADSNLRPVLPTIQKVNINTRVPQYLEFLAKDLLDKR